MSDLIKREEAIKAVWKPKVNPNDLIFDALKTAIESKINDIPSAEPSVGYVGVDDDYLVSVKEVLNITAETGALETQRRVKELPRRDRPQGHYIKGENDEWYCSNCKRIDDKYSVAKFCWYCGARMKGAEDE